MHTHRRVQVEDDLVRVYDSCHVFSQLEKFRVQRLEKKKTEKRSRVQRKEGTMDRARENRGKRMNGARSKDPLAGELRVSRSEQVLL